MIYYVSAWIVDGAVSSIECAQTPITENHMPGMAFDFRVVAQVSGDYRSANELFPLMSWDGEALIGVPIISQTVETGGA
jgi:hypothetical protein